DASFPLGLKVDLLHVTAADNLAVSLLYAQAWSDYALTVSLTNTLLSGFDYAFVVEEADQGQVTLSADHTLYQEVLTPTQVLAGAPTVSDLNPLGGDPRLDESYRLTTGSAAVDAGAVTGVLYDLDGQVRPDGSAPDVGADELSPRRLYLPALLR
ncbi:MAG: choice-of-anchor Q domain-containing protein, partial [Candidatus Promineifilaceae bacterium]|nr:choice-of-anchor Q domain-containing protein [Candidatus Promineifilaceae bacterium]